jgi:hypothetical protein
MTAHRIDEDFKFHACTMGCWLHEGGSTTEDLRQAFLINLFKDCKFDLGKVNIVACVTDTPGNMSKFGRLLEEMGVSPHICCADHVLQLTVKKAYLDSWFNAGTNGVTLNDAEMLDLDEVRDLDTMKKARRLVEPFIKSNQQLEKLQNQQKNLDTYTGKQAVGMVDVVTRWWSAYSMCERLIYFQPVLVVMAVDNKLPDYILLD